MASSAGAGLSEESENLYAALIAAAQASPEGLRKAFFQNDLQTTSNIASANELMTLVAELSSHNLIRTLKSQGSLCWATRPRDAARAVSLLSGDEKLLYTNVEDTHVKGIWIKELKKRSGVPAANVQKLLNKLESSHLIKSIKNVRAPAQKTYMLYHLAPSDDVTGGSFFDAGDLDESLIEELSNLIIFHVRMQSWAEAKPAKRVKREAAPITIDVDDDDEDDESRRKRRKTSAKNAVATGHATNHDIEDAGVRQLAFPAYTRAYPTAAAIHSFITTTDAIRAAKAQQLSVAEIQGVIDVLVWDDKLEKVGAGYRTVRGVSFKPPGFGGDEEEEEEDGNGNGSTQVPCARCPVFDICEEGGPVNPGNCVYFDEWLGGDG